VEREREIQREFEQAMRKHEWGNDKFKRPGGCYTEVETIFAFKVWELATANERKECAALCDELSETHSPTWHAEECAAAIRARRNK